MQAAFGFAAPTCKQPAISFNICTLFFHEHIMPAIEFQNVVFAYGDRTILKNVNFVIEQGKFAAILGGSGSGKTTMMRLITGQLRPSSGKVLVNGEDLAQFSAQKMQAHRRNMGVLFQHGALFTDLSVEENIMFPLDMFTNLTYTEKKKRVKEVIDDVHLENADHKYPSEISGGMQKRVAIARAIVNNPKYLFCDEPNSGLDPYTSKVIDDLIKEITRRYNTTTIINTHDMNSVMTIGEKIVYLRKGVKEWEGNKDILINAESQYLIDFVYSSELFKELRQYLLNNNKNV